MIKCHFVDVKSISSKLPRSSFDETELDLIADSILSTNGLLRPLVLERTGVEEYQVIAGDREYYAAVRAKEKDIKQAEMVNAFVIESNHKSAALVQLDLLTTSRSRSVRSAESIPDIDPLLASISQIIAQQLQPLLTQLDRYEIVLNKVDLNTQPTKPKTPKTRTTKKTEVDSNLTEAQTAKDRSTVPKTTKTKTSKKIATESTILEAIPSEDRSPKPTITEAKTTKTRSRSVRHAESTATKTTKTKSTATQQIKSVEVVSEPQLESAKSTTNPLAAVDPIKAVKTLDLIDRLDEDMLMRRMKQSGIAKAEQLVPKIIAQRELQPNGKFDSWQQIAAAKISGLGEATIVKIIDKLK